MVTVIMMVLPPTHSVAELAVGQTDRQRVTEFIHRMQIIRHLVTRVTFATTEFFWTAPDSVAPSPRVPFPTHPTPPSSGSSSSNSGANLNEKRDDSLRDVALSIPILRLMTLSPFRTYTVYKRFSRREATQVDSCIIFMA